MLLPRPSAFLADRVRLTGPDEDGRGGAGPFMMSEDSAAICSRRCSGVVDSPKSGTLRCCSRSDRVWMGEPGGKKDRVGADDDESSAACAPPYGGALLDAVDAGSSPNSKDGSMVALQSGKPERLVSNASSACSGGDAETKGREDPRGDGVEMGRLGGVGRSYSVGEVLWVEVPLEPDDEEEGAEVEGLGDAASACGSERARSLEVRNMARS